MYQDFIGRPKWELDTPALMIDLDKMERNIQAMERFLREKTGGRTRLRPHSKTHKTPEIAWKQLEAGAVGITCQKLGEAEVMADAGIRHLLVSNQIVGPTKIARLMKLAQRSDIMVCVDDANNVDDLSAAATAAGVSLRVLVEVNHGMNRCGVEPGEPTLALARKVLASPGLRFMGIQAYEGHLVMEAQYADRKIKTEQALSRAMSTRQYLEDNGVEVKIFSGGGTGTYDITGCFDGVTELQAGSYVTMDAQYKKLGMPFECALTVLTTIISRPRPGGAVGDSGLKVITRDFGMPEVVGWPGVKILGLSEEHTRLEVEEPQPDLKPGAKIELIPSHGCTTYNLHDYVFATRNDVVEAVWRIAGRGRSQ